MTLYVEPYLSYITGNSVVVTDASQPTIRYFEATVKRYISATGQLDLYRTQNIQGGYYGDDQDIPVVYNVNLDGIDGPTGATGPTGSTGPTGTTGPQGPVAGLVKTETIGAGQTTWSLRNGELNIKQTNNFYFNPCIYIFLFEFSWFFGILSNSTFYCFLNDILTFK